MENKFWWVAIVAFVTGIIGIFKNCFKTSNNKISSADKKLPPRYNSNTSTDKQALIEEIENNLLKCQEAKKACYLKYEKIMYNFKIREAISSAFSGDMGIKVYMADFIHFCTDSLNKLGNNSDSIKLLGYHTILSSLQNMINRANDKKNAIKLLTETEYYSKNNFNTSKIALSLNMDMEELKQFNQEIIKKYKTMTGEYEELCNKEIYYNNDISGKNNEILFSDIEKCHLDDFKNVNDLNEYKTKLITLSKKFENMLEIAEKK